MAKKAAAAAARRTRAPRPPQTPPRVRNDKKTQHQRPPHPGEAERMAVRRLKALELRIEGHSFRAIAKALQVDASTICRDLAAERAELDALTRDARENERALDLARIDRAVMGLMRGVDRGTAKSVMALMRTLDRRAKLLGLDAPTKFAGPTGGPIEVVQLYVPDNGRRRPAK